MQNSKEPFILAGAGIQETSRWTPSSAATAKPWYREPWLWLLVAPPAASVVIGIALWTVALRTNDGLVVDDYYTRGLAINQVLDREARAQRLAVHAALSFDPDRMRVRLALDQRGPVPERVILRFIHPTRTGEDQVIVLGTSAAGRFEGPITRLASGRWRVVLEDPVAGWRLAGWWRTGEAGVELGIPC